MGSSSGDSRYVIFLYTLCGFAILRMPDYVLKIWKDADMSIWEVRSRKQNYTYSKIMLWVAFDRGIRLSEKRCLPCPNKNEWLRVRDTIYEEIMEKGDSCAHVASEFYIF